MSKYVKNLITDHLRERLEDVHDALVVSVVGLDANANHRLRTELHAKGISLMVVKNSLAARATAGTPLSAMFDGLNGTAAICWGAEDIVSLAREVTRLAKDEQYAPFEPRGGVMDGERLSANQVAEVSRWPGRREQISILLGQILSPGANLASQLTGPGGALAAQIAERAGPPDEERAADMGIPDSLHAERGEVPSGSARDWQEDIESIEEHAVIEKSADGTMVMIRKALVDEAIEDAVSRDEIFAPNDVIISLAAGFAGFSQAEATRYMQEKTDDCRIEEIAGGLEAIKNADSSWDVPCYRVYFR